MAPLPSSNLVTRQSTSPNPIIPANYTFTNGMQPGAVVGITLGSVALFVLICWMIYTLVGGNMQNAQTLNDEEVAEVERKQSTRSRSHRSRRDSRRERSRSGGGRGRGDRGERIREVPVVERIVVEERRSGSRAPPAPPPPPPMAESSVGSTVDEIVVIEDHSPPRRRSRSRRGDGGGGGPPSGYRVVDPGQYGGGEGRLRDVDRRGSRRSGR